MSAQPIDDGGSMFPLRDYKRVNDVERATDAGGLSIRDWLAGQAPIDYAFAEAVYGGEPSLAKDKDRGVFLAVWTMLRYEWADSMLAARKAGAA